MKSPIIGGADSVRLKLPDRTIPPTRIDEGSGDQRADSASNVLTTPGQWLAAVHSGQVDWRTVLAHEDRIVGDCNGSTDDAQNDYELILTEAVGCSGDVPCGV